MAKKAKKNFFLQKTGIKGVFERNKGGFRVNFSLQKQHAREFWPSACSRNELSTTQQSHLFLDSFLSMGFCLK